MSLGIIEVITLLMGLSGLSVQNNPKAPAPEAALEYALPDADLVAHVDAVALVPHNYKVLTALKNQPQIKASPELAKLVRKAVAEIDAPRGLAKSMIGIDLTTDIHDATAFLRIVPKQDPDVVVAVRGKFKPDTIDKIAKVIGKVAVKQASGVSVDTGDGNTVALTRSGVMLAGTSTLVKDRLAAAWRAPALTTGSSLGNVADVIRGKPVFAVVITMSQAARNAALAEIKGKNFLSDVIKRHRFWSFAAYSDGIGWTWIDSHKNGLDAMAQISEGSIEVLRAAQIAPRGFAKIVLGALESYRGTNKQVDDLLRRKADVQKIIQSYTGDGSFKAQVDKDPAKLKLTVRLTGKSLSEVLPAGGLIPVGMVAWLTMSRAPARMEPPAQLVAPPAPRPAAPAKKGNAPPKRP